jgi:hypothetical protein
VLWLRKNQMKYYLGRLYLYDKYLYSPADSSAETIFIFKTDKDAQAFVDQQSRTFYGDVEEDEDGVLWVPDSSTAIDGAKAYEIKKDTFDDLKSTGMQEVKDEKEKSNEKHTTHV